MDERKRTFEGASEGAPSSGGGHKRLRPEDIVGFRDDPSKSIARLLLNRAQFSRVIGKQGQTIAHIRNATGVNIKGMDVDEETRLVIITGNFDQTLQAFDMIVDLLHQAAVAEITAANNALPPGIPRTPVTDHMAIHIMLEHSKAGKAVGSKGTMMQNIKMKSQAASIRIEKEPMDISGVSLRRLTIEGSVASIRRAHMLVQELYVDQNAAAPGGYNSYGGNMDHGARGGNGYGNGPSAYDAPVGGAGVGAAAHHMATVPFPTLVNYGVQPETVRQLTEMKMYLWRHFGLDLSISREEVVAAPPARPPTDNFNNYGNNVQQNRSNGNTARPSIESIIDARKASNPAEVCFSIPRQSVGAVIGKGGQNLRDLHSNFGVRVYIEKEDFNGKRLVVLSYVGSGPDNEAVLQSNLSLEEALKRCQERVEMVVDEQSKHKQGGEASFQAEHEA